MLAKLALVTTLLMLVVTESRLHVKNLRHLKSLGAQTTKQGVASILAASFYVYPIFALVESFFWQKQVPGLLFGLAIGLLTLSLALRVWAIYTLGQYWSFSCSYVKDAPILFEGPYSFLKHPEYLARSGEVIALCLLLFAPVTGFLVFSLLLWFIPIFALAESKQMQELAAAPFHETVS